ncbi:MAG: hypothetical protein P8Y62_06950 [candidate division WOR-3 bacterium]
MLFLLMLSFYSEFDWYQLEMTGRGGIYEGIMESSVVKEYGTNRIEKKFIYLTSGIFGGGSRVLFSKGSEIRGLPKGLKLMKRAIRMKKFDRYSALYEEGELKHVWKELEKESARKLGIPSLTLQEMRKICPEDDFKNEKGEIEPSLILEKIKGVKYPLRIYYSFMDIEENRTRKLIPVVMKLCPMDEKIEEYIRGLNSKGD